MFNLYKPNSKTTGSACKFESSIKDGKIFTSFIKQHSWNDGLKTGSFEGNKKNPKATVNAKLSLLEAGAILDCIDRNRDLSVYHKSENQQLGIKFVPYKREVNENGAAVTKQVGFSYSIIKTVGEEKTSFLIGLSFAEARVLREFLITAIQEHYKFLLWNRQDYFDKKDKKEQDTAEAAGRTPAAKAPVATPEPAEEEQPPAVDETDLDA